VETHLQPPETSFSRLTGNRRPPCARRRSDPSWPPAL